MIKAKFFLNGKILSGFEVSGHSGSAEAGQDIVCSAVSSAVIMAANTVTEIAKIPAETKAESGYMFFKVSQAEDVQYILRGLELHLKELEKQYPDYLKITYGGN